MSALEAYGQYGAARRTLLSGAIDGSNLALDAEILTYHLMDAALIQATGLMDHIAETARYGAAVLKPGSALQSSRIETLLTLAEARLADLRPSTANDRGQCPPGRRDRRRQCLGRAARRRGDRGRREDDGRDPSGLGPDREHLLGDRRDRVPDRHPGAQRRGRGDRRCRGFAEGAGRRPPGDGVGLQPARRHAVPSPSAAQRISGGTRVPAAAPPPHPTPPRTPSPR
jgi:hypothetical protein